MFVRSTQPLHRKNRETRAALSRLPNRFEKACQPLEASRMGIAARPHSHFNPKEKPYYKPAADRLKVHRQATVRWAVAVQLCDNQRSGTLPSRVRFCGI